LVQLAVVPPLLLVLLPELLVLPPELDVELVLLVLLPELLVPPPEELVLPPLLLVLPLLLPASVAPKVWVDALDQPAEYAMAGNARQQTMVVTRLRFTASSRGTAPRGPRTQGCRCLTSGLRAPSMRRPAICRGGEA
jgi:hypothetical protein